MMIISCYKLHQAGLWDMRRCCGTCHHDDEDDLYALDEVEPPYNLRHRTLSYARVCCACRQYLAKLSRDDWARAIWAIRKIKPC